MTIHTLPTQEVLCYRAHTGILRHGAHWLIADIQAHGIHTPLEILTDGTYAKLKNGHQRLLIASQLEMKEVPVTVIEHVFTARERVKRPLMSGLRGLLRPAD